MGQNIATPTVTTQKRPPIKPKRSRRVLLLAGLLSILTGILILHWIAFTHTAFPLLSPASCSDTIRKTDYTKIIPRLTPQQEMQAIQLTSDVTSGEPSALIQVVTKNDNALLDVYMYGCTIRQQSPTLIPLLKRQGLIQGLAQVTQAHTLSISELDSNLSSDTISTFLPMQQNIYHEYGWMHGQLTQIKFPALYPVTSRCEAEALQDIINHDPDPTPPWVDPVATTIQMASDLFHRPSDTIKARLLHQDLANAHVMLELNHPQTKVDVILSRLVQQNDKGLWFVTAAKSPGITLDQTNLNTPVTSPLIIHGTLTTTIGKATLQIMDHTLTPLQILNTPTQPHLPPQTSFVVRNNQIYTGTINYNNSYICQPGLLLIDVAPPNNKSPGQLLLTNLILR
jgi:hypothetical protein